MNNYTLPWKKPSELTSPDGDPIDAAVKERLKQRLFKTCPNANCLAEVET